MSEEEEFLKEGDYVSLTIVGCIRIIYESSDTVLIVPDDQNVTRIGHDGITINAPTTSNGLYASNDPGVYINEVSYLESSEPALGIVYETPDEIKVMTVWSPEGVKLVASNGKQFTSLKQARKTLGQMLKADGNG